jgi:hypothetical protein
MKIAHVCHRGEYPPTDLPWGHRAVYFRDPDANFSNFSSLIA